MTTPPAAQDAGGPKAWAILSRVQCRPGRFRTGGVGIYRVEEFVHMAPPASRVHALVADLLGWLEKTD